MGGQVTHAPKKIQPRWFTSGLAGVYVRYHYTLMGLYGLSCFQSNGKHIWGVPPCWDLGGGCVDFQGAMIKPRDIGIPQAHIGIKMIE